MQKSDDLRFEQMLRVVQTYSITLIGCSQGSLSRRGEEVIRKVFTENDCSTLTDLESKSWFNYLSLYYINKERGK